MKIFLTVSRSGLPKFAQTYMEVLEELQRQGTLVATTFTKTYLNKKPQLKGVKELSVSEDKYRYVHDTAIRQAIFRADAVVIEASYPSYRLGFETFFALSKEKPVLTLSRFQNYGNLIDHPNFFGAKYTSFTLPDEIEKFLRHVKKYKLRNRFNLFISDAHKQYVEKAATQYKVSRSDYIRKLIEADMKSGIA